MFRTGLPPSAILVAAVMSAALAARADAASRTFQRRVPLTVDTIMRGPDLVGYPPTWSALVRRLERLYFEWRKPGEDEAPRMSSRGRRHAAQAQRRRARSAPASQRTLGPARGGARSRQRRHRDGRLGRGDAPLDRAHVGREANPRWARNDTHVTYMRDGNLFIVPIAAGERLIQLTDVAVKKTRAAADREPEIPQGRGARSSSTS